MTSMPFEHVVKSIEELRDKVGEPSELARKKQIPALDAHCRAFIAGSPFVLVATASASGQCDVSPKGDAPGFVQVVDDHRLFLPDRPGNRRFDGMRNILENPHVGLIFLIPGREETLRVNGQAYIVRDPVLLERATAMGKRPDSGIGVLVEEVFLHCAKAFKRSKLWQRDTWPDPASVPSMARMLLDQAKPVGMTLEDLEKRLQLGYTTQLY
jgi:PPOX class probable FMN-dependent enzyme